MVAIQEVPEGERLHQGLKWNARLTSASGHCFVIREDMLAMNSDFREDMREFRKEARGYFFWTLGILVGM